MRRTADAAILQDNSYSFSGTLALYGIHCLPRIKRCAVASAKPRPTPSIIKMREKTSFGSDVNIPYPSDMLLTNKFRQRLMQALA